MDKSIPLDYRWAFNQLLEICAKSQRLTQEPALIDRIK